MMKRRKKDFEFGEKWVECLNCSHEYVIENVIDERDTKGCPVCGSYAYEESANDYMDWGE
ncbi:hypothetical protein [Cytobacillus oceanisediminis]|uniref:hypothetical protein n=1 Tax=Cytobacillus oceanisediminis TaxID=665099 RepID=UPI001FB3DF98|nr:hypothetical protein [Cytobacillus oceanisediminis]UOE58251.1 hypothetical protein IRB79_27340 [Cytobacillus oceanisediminis]